MTDQAPPPLPPGESAGRSALSGDGGPLVPVSGGLVAVGLVLLLVGVLTSWHWRAAVLGAVLCSLAAFAAVLWSAYQQRDQLVGEAGPGATFAPPAHHVDEPLPRTAPVRDEPEAAVPPAPRPRKAGLGRHKQPEPPPPPRPEPSNVHVMPVTGGHVRITPTPQPMPISRPDRPSTPAAGPSSRPPSTPPGAPPTIQVGTGRDPSFPTYRPVDPDAPVIQVRNRYHRPDCRYVQVADEAVETTVGAARATNAMPCGVCRP